METKTHVIFHRKATWRAKNNSIRKLKKENGEIVELQAELEALTNEYFDEMYTKDTFVVPGLIEEVMDQKVSQEMNDDLIREFTDEEIGDALFQIGPLKAPGAHGLPPRFFQRNWGIVKGEVIAAVKNFFVMGLCHRKPMKRLLS
jgi:hypothetical protein